MAVIPEYETRSPEWQSYQEEPKALSDAEHARGAQKARTKVSNFLNAKTVDTLAKITARLSYGGSFRNKVVGLVIYQ